MNPRNVLALGAIALVVLTLPLATAAAAQAPMQSSTKDRVADVNGVKLHYLIAGKGEPVVLLHGYAQTSHMWRDRKSVV